MKICPVFGQCGGCTYQDKSYREELRLKEKHLKDVLNGSVFLKDDLFAPIVASPKVYHYRHRLDLKLVKTKEQKVFMGFSPKKGYPYGVVEVEDCPIAMKPVSRSLKKIRPEAIAAMGTRYRRANLVVRTGDKKRVDWGGIGRGSLKRSPEAYLWSKVVGRKIFYSMDTFFQANLSILPKLVKYLRRLPLWGREVCLYDLYGGVGLFSVALAEKVGRVVLVEENKAAVRCAAWNKEYNKLKNMDLHAGRLEDLWPKMASGRFKRHVAIIDPPRDGLTAEAAGMLSGTDRFSDILYLSCYPEALARDLKVFKTKAWKVQSIQPFDFFPRTRHVETLVWLTKESA